MPVACSPAANKEDRAMMTFNLFEKSRMILMNCHVYIPVYRLA